MKTNWTIGDISGSSTLLDADHLYPAYFNELRTSVNALEDGSHFGAFVNAGDYATVNAAADALPAAGGTVWVPPGNYTISAMIDKPRIAIIGAGKMLTTITATATMSAMIRFDDDITGEKFTLRDLKLDGDNKVDECVSLAGSFAYIHNVDMTNATVACIYTSSFGVHHIFSCNVGNAPYAIYSYDGGVNSVVDRMISNCDNGIWLRHEGTTAPEGWRIVNSTFFPAAGYGITANDVNTLFIDNCAFDGCLQRGIHLEPGCIQAKITNNYIACNNSVDPALGDGIGVDETCSGIYIAGNTITTCAGRGINVKATIADYCSNIQIHNNSFSLNTTADIVIDSALYNYVTGNYCPHLTYPIIETATFGAAKSVVTGNFCGTTPTKSGSSHWDHNWGDDIS